MKLPKIKLQTFILGIFILFFVLSLFSLLLGLSEKLGQFGDSFGVITSLFS